MSQWNWDIMWITGFLKDLIRQRQQPIGKLVVPQYSIHACDVHGIWDVELHSILLLCSESSSHSRFRSPCCVIALWSNLLIKFQKREPESAGGKRPVQVVIQEGICGGIPSSNLQVAGIPKGRDLWWDISDPRPQVQGIQRELNGAFVCCCIGLVEKTDKCSMYVEM